VDFTRLKKIVAEDSAIRRRQRLQPVGGPGDKIFPPTYPGDAKNAPARHVIERRRVAGKDVWCALVDSVQSQANRMEESILTAIRESSVAVPYVTVDFKEAGLVGISDLTSLDAPHRVYDAILRDSLLDGIPFPKSGIGKALAEAKPSNATAVLEASPTALVFGAWNSTGEGGGIGAKFPRVLVSEIVAVNVTVEDGPTDRRTGEVEVRTAGRRTGSRIDPLGVLRRVKVYQDEAKQWDTSPEGLGPKAKQVRPSEINHGNIAPSVQPLGITCDFLEHTVVISFAGLRRLGFGGENRDVTGRAYLAALGLLAAVEQDSRGYALRSRCDLVCEDSAPLELVSPDGSVQTIKIDRAGARRLYLEALAAARQVGFDLKDQPVRLKPQEKLIHIVRQSQELAREGEGGETEDE
jgi:CRISPR-associated protein Csb1